MKKNVIRLLPMLVAAAFVVCFIVFSGNTMRSAWGMTMTKETCQRCHGTDQAVIVSWHHQIRETNNWSCTICHKTISDGTGGYTVEIQRDCTACHTPGYHTEPAGTNAKRHHAIRNANDYGCLHCHPAVTDANGDVTIVVSRDCFFCHTDSLKPWREVKYLDNLPTTTSPDTSATITDITSKFQDTLMYESYEVVNTTTTDKALSVRLDKDAATTSKVTLGFYVFEPATPRATIRIYPYLLDGVTVDTSASVDIRVSASGWVEGDVTSLASKMSGFTWMKFRVTVIDGPLYLSEGSFQILRPTTDPGSTNQIPLAMAGSDQIVYIGDTVNFSGTLSNDPDGTIASYEWNFGDGASAGGPTASHVYTAGGAYLVGLKVTDNLGAYAEDFLFVNVKTYSLPPNTAPVANAGPDITATSGQPVTLSAAASTDSDGQVASWTWSFQDGTSASGETVTKIFTVPGTYTVSLTITDNQGAIGNDAVVVTVNAPVVSGVAPIANAGTDFYATVGETVTFNGAGSSDPDGTIASYSWDFGDGTKGTGVAPKKAYTTAGVYIATLTVTDNTGAKATDTVTITIHAVIKQNLPPLANAGAGVTATTGQTVSFSGAGSSDSDGTIASYAWNFGDGTTATGINATKIYQNAGTFTVTLTVTDNGGATATAATTATITPPLNTPPVANAGADATAKTGQALTFSGAASKDTDGTIASYIWNFGDNSSANGVTVTKTYTAAGTYTVTLTVTDNAGGKATDTAIVTVAANKAPVASAGPDITATVNKPVTLSAAGSSDSDGSVASYSWRFSNSSTTTTGISATKTFSSTGTYTATLTVKDDLGATATDSVIITVVSNQAPLADAGADVTATAGQTITFTGTGTDPDGTISSYSWSFGDGTTKTGATVTKSYASTGTYTVRLTVTDNGGKTASDAMIATIVANKAPTANAGPDVSTTLNQSISFSGAASTDSDGTIASYSWSFGDGSSATGMAPTKSYTSAGTYAVTLTVTDNAGATATDTAVVTVAANKPPIANAGADATTSVNASVTFSGAGSSDTDGTIASYNWTFGDGTSATGISASKSYAAAGTYTATLTVTDNNGATATDTAVVTVSATPINVPPVANAGSDITGTVGAAITFTGTGSTDQDGSIDTYVWSFGDGTTKTGATVTKNYTAAGTYTVTLTVTDNTGAKATDTAIVTIRPRAKK